MGESRTIQVLRTALVAVAAAAALTSCSQLGLGPSAPGSTAGTSPSEPAAVTPQPTVASPDPVAPATPTPTATAADGRAAVEPFITSAVLQDGRLDVGAIVPGVVEDGGRCTLTATDGSATRTATADAVAASSYTGCGPLELTGLGSGPWQVRVRYASDAATGTTAVRTVSAG